MDKSILVMQWNLLLTLCFDRTDFPFTSTYIISHPFILTKNVGTFSDQNGVPLKNKIKTVEIIGP
jgi:uncharacterized membrane protein YbaN (DUF454 family)